MDLIPASDTWVDTVDRQKLFKGGNFVETESRQKDHLVDLIHKLDYQANMGWMANCLDWY